MLHDVCNSQYPEFYEDEITYTFGIYVKKDLKKAQIKISNIIETSIPDVPIWDLGEIPVSFELAQYEKKCTSSEVYISKFREVQRKYNGFCHLYTDGSKVNEKASAAVYSPMGKIAFRMPNNSSIFTAEIAAIYKALEYVRASWCSKFVIFSDSMSVLESISSQESKNPLLNNLLQFIESLRQRKKIVHFCWVPSHVGIRGNEKADQAAKMGQNEPLPVHYKIPYTDFLPNVKSYVKESWQERWNNQVDNKLNAITPIIQQFKTNSLSRREQVIIHRIRIGHSRLTHSHLMERKPAPRCHFCNRDMLSIKHVMLECSKFMYSRRRHFHVASMKDLFDIVSLRSILDFVKDIGIFHSL